MNLRNNSHIFNTLKYGGRMILHGIIISEMHDITKMPNLQSWKTSKYLMILLYDMINRNKGSSYSVIQTFIKTWSLYFVLFIIILIIIQILTPVFKIKGVAINNTRVFSENFLCLGCRLWLGFVFPIIHRVALIYVYWWSNLLFSILASLLFIFIYENINFQLLNILGSLNECSCKLKGS